MKTDLCKELEQEIILLYECCRSPEENIIREFLSLRKRILDEHFEFNAENHQRLYECNEQIKLVLLKSQNAYIQADNLKRELLNQHKEVEFEVLCRPVYEEDNIIQNALCEYGWKGLEPNIFWGLKEQNFPLDEDELFYAKLDSWDEGLPKEWAKDIKLTRSFHHLFDHTCWALEDILSIQQYEINVKYDITEPVAKR